MVGIGHSHAEGVMDEIEAQEDTFEFAGYYEANPNTIRNKEKTFGKYQILDFKKLMNNEYGLQGLLIEDTITNTRKRCISF